MMDAKSTIIDAEPTRRRVIRLRTLTRLRWFAICGQLAVCLGVRLGLGFEMPVGLILTAVGITIWVNIFTMLKYPPNEPLRPWQLVGYLCFDTIQIAFILYLTGGIQNPFAVWLILPAVLGASALDMRRAAIVVAMVVIALTTIAVTHFPLPWRVEGELELPWIYDFGTWVSLMLGVGFTSAYAHQVSMEQMKLGSALETTQKVLAREERLTALGGLAAAAAHELGTPLATIQVTAREMEREVPDGPLKEDAQLLISQTQRCQKILQRLSDTGEGGDERHSVLALEDVLKEAARPFLAGDGPEIEFTFDAQCEGCPPERLRRMPEVIYSLRTLIENAVKYADATVRLTARWDHQMLAILIEDDGPGFPADVLTRLGEPYPRSDSFRKSVPKQGLGLGFFIAKTLLERTGASIAVNNGGSFKGACIEISWPLANLRARPTSSMTAND